MKKTEPIPVGEIIRQAIASTGHADAFERHRVCALWIDVVGPSINRMTTRRWVDGKTLHVCIASPSLRNDLSFMQRTIIDNLNRAAGANLIERIIFH